MLYTVIQFRDNDFYLILQIRDSQLIVPYFIKILVAQIEPEIKPILMIRIAITFPVSVLYFEKTSQAIRQEKIVVPNAI